MMVNMRTRKTRRRCFAALVGVAVSRISESAGISKAAIYRYKED